MRINFSFNILIAVFLITLNAQAEKKLKTNFVLKKKTSFFLNASLNTFKLGNIYKDIFRPTGISNLNYKENIFYRASGGVDDPLIKRFELSQYEPFNHRGRLFGESGSVYSPQILNISFLGGYEINPMLTVGLNMNIWTGRQSSQNYNIFFILDELNTSNFKGMIEVDKKDSFEVQGLFGGASLDVKIPSLKFLGITPFANFSLNVGQLLTFKSISDIHLRVRWVANSQTSPLTNDEGGLKNEAEVISTGFEDESVNDIRITKTFNSPWVMHNTINIGFEYEIGNRIRTQLYGGITWFLIQVDNVTVDYVREYALFSTDSSTEYLEGPTTANESFREDGFFHQSISWSLGVKFIFNI